MIHPRIPLPKEYAVSVNTVTPMTKRFPCYVKKVGYSNEPIFELTDGSLSEVLVLYTLSGTASFQKVPTDTPLFLKEHDVISIPCHASLSFHKIGADEWVYLYVIVGGTHSSLYQSFTQNSSATTRLNPTNRVLNHMAELLSIHYDGSTRANFYACSLLHWIFMELYEVSYHISINRNALTSAEANVQAAIEYITKNYQKDLSLDAICAKMGFSKYYFCRLFKEQTGQTIHQYVSDFRVNKSKELLVYSNLPINTVAAVVGFQSPLTYIRCFKRVNNMTPSQYREANQKGMN